MLPYQQEYIDNAKEIAVLSSFYSGSGDGFDAWYAERQRDLARIRELKAENISLLNLNLFPVLDELYGASDETIASLEEFADLLMDWKTNLDCGVYVVIHDALLSLYRVRKERDSVIKELYKLGMGIYYLRRFTTGVIAPEVSAVAFANEMVFTEAASYIRYFDVIEDETTKGYIIRAFANIALCAEGHKKRVHTSARTLQIIQDEHYRALAPGLPWDTFLRRTHQQMSSNRSELSKGDMTREELAAVLDSCYEVFKPEEGADNPSIRWLWPYYEMEYNCGYVDLKLTLERLKELIRRTPYDRYDMSGIYGNVQLAIYYGRLMRKNPQLRSDPENVAFLDSANRKMLKTLLTCPVELFDDYFFYNVDVVVSGYYETEGTLSYRELTDRLMQRFAGELYIRSRLAGDLTCRFCDAIFAQQPDFFDDIPFLAAISDPAEKRAALLAHSEGCGLYHDFGLIKMNIGRTMQTRNLFENEFRMYLLHTVSGHADLLERPSTAAFADVALGHHSWYNGAGGYPEKYVRLDSPYRQMTDVVAVVSYMIERYFDEGVDVRTLIGDVISKGRDRFSPQVVSYLNDEGLVSGLAALLESDCREYYRTVYRGLLSGDGELS